MFLQRESQDLSSTELEEFTKWILHVGDGKIGEDSDGYASINIPQELLISNFDNPIEAIVQTTYPNFIQEYKNEKFLKNRVILASTFDTIDQINDYVLSLIPGFCFIFFFFMLITLS